MFRHYSPTAILPLIVFLLLLPLQGHARMMKAEAPMPCAMEHHGMQGMSTMMSMQGDHPCDSGTPCSADCLACAGCTHCPAGIALTPHNSPSRFVTPRYAVQSEPAYSSISLFQDHPPPRIA